MPKNIRVNATLYFIKNIPHKKKLQQIPSSHLSAIRFKDFMGLYKECTKKLLVLVKHTTWSSDNPLPFRKNLS